MEYQINENTYYGKMRGKDIISDGAPKGKYFDAREYVRYQREGGESLVVSFAVERINASVEEERAVGGFAPNYAVEVALLKPETKVEKAKNNVFKKLFSKKSTEQESESKPEEVKKVLFRKEFDCHRDVEDDRYHADLSLFLRNPIKLDKEYQEVSKIIEKARQTILTDGHAALEKGLQEEKEQEALKKQNAARQESLNRTALDKQIADKIKGYGL